MKTGANISGRRCLFGRVSERISPPGAGPRRGSGCIEIVPCRKWRQPGTVSPVSSSRAAPSRSAHQHQRRQRVSGGTPVRQTAPRRTGQVRIIVRVGPRWRKPRGARRVLVGVSLTIFRAAELGMERLERQGSSTEHGWICPHRAGSWPLEAALTQAFPCREGGGMGWPFGVQARC
jgi:hypothetical protein